MGETEIGMGLTGFGIFFTFLGIVFFFDKGLLAMGNILFISGVSLTIGPKSTMQFFMKRQNFKVGSLFLFTLQELGTISFGAGFFFVVIGWPIIAASGQHCRCSYRGYQFLVGSSNCQQSDHSWIGTGAEESPSKTQKQLAAEDLDSCDSHDACSNSGNIG
ncbi:Vesicle transport protein GOT1 [Linum perenne]